MRYSPVTFCYVEKEEPTEKLFPAICGWIADQTSSRRSPLLLGLLALLGATIMPNVGSSCSVLVAARVLQGISAAAVWVIGLALLADTVDPKDLGRSMGYVGLGMSAGTLIAPLLGGVVFDNAGYNAVFGMAYAFIGIDIMLRLALVEKKVAVRWDPDAQEDQAGGATLTQENETDSRAPSKFDPEKEIATSSSAQSPDAPIPAPTIPTQDAAISSPRLKLRHRLPPLLALLYSRRLISALWGALVQASLITAFDSVLTIHVASVFHWHSTAAALLFLPLVNPSFLAPLAGWISDRRGPRYLSAAGFLLACPPFVCLRYVNSNTMSDKVLLCGLLAAIGLSLTLTFPPFMAEIAVVAEAKEHKMKAERGKGWGNCGAYAQAYGLFNMAFAGGCLVGPVWAGFIRNKAGWATMAWTLGLLSAITSVPTFLWMGGWIGEAGFRELERKEKEDEEAIGGER